jgi:hypothetical protein
VLFFWLKRRKRVVDPVLADIRRQEEDCMRRLAFVDTQLRRMVEKRSHWSAAMTVVDADIMPVGRRTHVVSTVKAMRPQHRYAAIAAGVALLLLLIVMLALCGAGAPEIP